MSADNRVRVLVIDDHEIVRRGVVDVVDADPQLTVVAEAGTVLDAIRRAAAVRPDVAIVDLKLPDGTGIDVVRALRKDHPEIRCVVLTSFDDDQAVEAEIEVLLATIRTEGVAPQPAA